MSSQRCWIFPLFSILLMSGCTQLNSTSDFSDAVSSVKNRNNYVQVVAKSIQPDTAAVTGANLVKSNLSYIAINYKNINPKLNHDKINNNNQSAVHNLKDKKYSYIEMSVSYFNHYDKYQSVSILDNSYALNKLQPTVESCGNNCISTQWFSFPFSSSDLKMFPGKLVNFTLISTNHKQIKVSLPKAYFESIEQELHLTINKNSHLAIHKQAEPVSKVLSMTQYWYQQLTSAQQHKFIQYAVVQRKRKVTVQPKMEDNKQSQAENMIHYWYQKGNKEQRLSIINWLMKQ